MGPILETARLLLRPFREADRDPFVAYRSDPVVALYQGWDLPYTGDQAAAFIDEMMRSQPGQPGVWYQFAIELTATGQMVGDCAVQVLADDARQAEIGITLARRHQGHGYATEALARLVEYLFGDLHLHRVRAICDAENGASARLLQRLGMRREAHFIDHVWFKGRWASEYWYALLRAEWAARTIDARIGDS